MYRHKDDQAAADNSAKTGKRLGGPGRPFPKGTSGNPGGRPKTKALSAAYRLKLESIDPSTGRTYADLIADKVIAQALKGDMAAVREIADRSEGKPGNKVHYAKDYGWIDMTCLTMEQLEKIAAGEDPDLVVRDDAHA